MSTTIVFVLQKRLLYLVVLWTFSVFIVSITLPSVWWWSCISNVLSVLIKIIHVWVWCGNKLKSKILQTEEEQAHLFAKLSWLRKTLCQTQDCAKQKTLCLLKKMNNDNNGVEETPQPETLSQFFDNMSNDFWQFNLVTSPSQNAEVFLHNCWGFLWVLMCFQRCCTSFTWWDSGLFC